MHVSSFRIGILIAAAACFAAAFYVLYHSGRHELQAAPVFNAPAALPGRIQTTNSDTYEEMLIQALGKKPDHAPILLELARQEAEAGQVDKASGHIREALQYEPKNLDAKLDLGKLSFEMGNIEEAIKLNLEILDDEPDHPDALYNLGAIYGNLENRERALFYWNRLLNTSPDSQSGLRAKTLIPRL